MNRVKRSARISEASATLPDTASSVEPNDGHGPLARFKGALVVDDDDPFRRALARWLRGCHIQVSEAKTVAEGADLLAREPDLIIIDVRLPDGNGRKLVELARARRRWPLIVAMSGLASAGEAFGLAQSGARLYLMKPFTPQDLLDALVEVSGDTSNWSTTRESSVPDPGLPIATEDLHKNLLWFARYYAVPQREMALVQLATCGVPRARCPEMLGVSENTCKTLTRRLLQRCGARSLAQIPRLVLIGAPHAPDA